MNPERTHHEITLPDGTTAKWVEVGPRPPQEAVQRAVDIMVEAELEEIADQEQAA